MRLKHVITLSVLMLGLWSCSQQNDKDLKKPVNGAEEVEEEEEVADRDQERPNLFDRNRAEIRQYEQNPGRYGYRFGDDSGNSSRYPSRNNGSGYWGE